MDVITAYATQALDFLSSGFNDVNQSAQGLLIALAATIFMQNWKQLIGMALLAVVLTLALETLLPVLANNARFMLPNIFEPAFLQVQLARFVGYIVIIAIFFAIKRALFRAAPAPAKGH